MNHSFVDHLVDKWLASICWYRQIKRTADSSVVDETTTMLPSFLETLFAHRPRFLSLAVHFWLQLVNLSI